MNAELDTLFHLLSMLGEDGIQGNLIILHRCIHNLHGQDQSKTRSMNKTVMMNNTVNVSALLRGLCGDDSRDCFQEEVDLEGSGGTPSLSTQTKPLTFHEDSQPGVVGYHRQIR